MKGIVLQFFLFKHYFDIVQPLLHSFVVGWDRYASPVEFCSYFMSYLGFKEVDEDIV